MSDAQGQRSIWRRIFGRPYRWQGIAWTVLGIYFLAIGAFDPITWWWWVAGLVWLLLGIPSTVIAFSDYRHRRGRYVARR